MAILLDILQIMPVGILITENKNVMYVNQNFKKLLNIENIADESLLDSVAKLIGANTESSAEELNITIDDKQLLVKIKSIDTAKQMYVITDITLCKKLNMKEIESNLKGKLIHLFLHEFKTPLHWLNGILSSIISNESTKQLLKMAKHAINLLNLYIDDMAFYSQIDQGREKAKTISKDFSIRKCINECNAFILADLTIGNIKFISSISESTPPLIYGDPNRYIQILNNILCHSIKSCKSNVGIIDVTIVSNGNILTTSITDNGVQMSIEEINLILNPLEKLENPNLQVRFGLGMILCNDMCKRIGGDLYVVATGKYNIYTFNMPYLLPINNENVLVELNSTAFLDVEENKDPISPRKLNISSLKLEQNVHRLKEVLVVDDTLFNNVILKNMLKLLNVECEVCTNGKEAVDIMVTCIAQYKFSVIFMDINMPVMDGIEVCLSSRPQS